MIGTTLMSVCQDQKREDTAHLVLCKGNTICLPAPAPPICMVKELKCKNQTVQYISESGQLPDNQHGLNEVTDPKMLFAVNPANVWDALIMKFWDDTSTDVLNN